MITNRRVRLYDCCASCNCYKVRLLLAHLDLAYERVAVDIFNGETLTDEYARVNPMRTTRVLELEDGRCLPESNAILLYLARGTRYLPRDAFALAQVVRWLIVHGRLRPLRHSAAAVSQKCLGEPENA